jgi:hypothetical protein
MPTLSDPCSWCRDIDQLANQLKFEPFGSWSISLEQLGISLSVSRGPPGFYGYLHRQILLEF